MPPRGRMIAMTAWRAPAGRPSWRKRGTGWSVLDGERWICMACREPVRSYQYRFHRPESSLFERCISLAWCPECRIYSSNTVHVPRKRVLVDALSSLPADDRDRLLRKEAALIDYLDRRGLGPE